MSDLRDKIYKTLRGYTMLNIRDADTGHGYPLVDLCTPEGRPISDGAEELMNLADDIAYHLSNPVTQ